jgi:hypothetical protein
LEPKKSFTRSRTIGCCIYLHCTLFACIRMI